MLSFSSSSSTVVAVPAWTGHARLLTEIERPAIVTRDATIALNITGWGGGGGVGGGAQWRRHELSFSSRTFLPSSRWKVMKEAGRKNTHSRAFACVNV